VQTVRVIDALVAAAMVHAFAAAEMGEPSPEMLVAFG
jgi:hypothetical protein